MMMTANHADEPRPRPNGGGGPQTTQHPAVAPATVAVIASLPTGPNVVVPPRQRE